MTEATHPVIDLLAFVDSDFDDRAVDALRDLARELATSDDGWLLAAPEFVDATDADGIRTLGLRHRFYAAYDTSGRLLDEALDRRHLEEVRRIVAGLRSVSAEVGVDIGLELDDDSVGWIEDGELTESLRVGLLESWAARFA